MKNRALSALVAALTAITAVSVVSAVNSPAPVSDLRYVRAEAGDSYWSLRAELGLSCTHTELWAANGRAPIDPGTIVFIPPWCTQPTTSTSTTTTTTTVPRPTRDVLIGATIDRRGTENWAQATERFERTTGGPVEVGRRFSPGFPPGRFDQVPAFAVDIGERHRFISVKGNPTRADWLRFLRTIPTDGFTTWVTINHEPENDGPSMTPEVFRARLRLMSDAIVEVGRADIRAALVLMSWAERDGNPSTSSALWFPDADIIGRFTLGLDPYDVNARTTPAQLVGPTLALWDAAGGGPWQIAETGTKRTGADGAAWIDAFGDLCFADPDCGALMWFDSPVGQHGPWYLDDPVMQRAWGDLARRTS